MKISLANLVIVVCATVCLPMQLTAEEEPDYSPYVNLDYPTRVLWGDTHLHTANSLDARLMGVTLGVEDAYRFARGEQVLATSGQQARLARPLDFLVVADHSDGIGVMNQLIRGNPQLLKHTELRDMYEALRSGSRAPLAANTIIPRVLGGSYSGPFLDESLMSTVWERYVETADRFNEPGRFTALIGYEWTPTKGGDNLHRNVIYRGGAKKARQLQPFTVAESDNPQELWRWMQRYEQATGGKVLALAHNGNLSNGLMFPLDTNPASGGAIDAEYVSERSRWEPLYEVTQIKGDGEAHPYLSPTDEFAGFEKMDRGNANMSKSKTPDMLQYEYAREALKNGLKLESTLGVNPYQFGMVGSTDSHTALATAEENNFFGKMTTSEPRPGRMAVPLVQAEIPGLWKMWEMSASGYAAVWAHENTREAIWDAMKRKEVYATTGPRITVRFFAGWNFASEDVSGHSLVDKGYARGANGGEPRRGKGQ